MNAEVVEASSRPQVAPGTLTKTGFTRSTPRRRSAPAYAHVLLPQLLRARLEVVRAPVLIFPFKRAAVAVIGKFDGNGWLDRTFAGADLFVMPGPYEASHTANATIGQLAERLR